jgi:sulfite reductase (NADPH) flavoprotein alpha-component
VCALGDTTYTHFCRCGKQLDAALAAAGAAALQPRVDVDKEDWPKVDAWIAGVLSGLTALAASGSLKSFAELGGVPNAAAGADEAAAAAAAAGSKFSKSRPYYARVVAVEGLCVLEGPDDKDTLRLELELGPDAAAAGGLAYLPGDALGIWPTNPPQVWRCDADARIQEAHMHSGSAACMSATAACMFCLCAPVQHSRSANCVWQCTAAVWQSSCTAPTAT